MDYKQRSNKNLFLRGQHEIETVAPLTFQYDLYTMSIILLANV